MLDRMNRINRIFCFYYPDNHVNPVKRKRYLTG